MPPTWTPRGSGLTALTIWVADDGADKLFAYALDNGMRNRKPRIPTYTPTTNIPRASGQTGRPYGLPTPAQRMADSTLTP